MFSTRAIIMSIRSFSKANIMVRTRKCRMVSSLPSVTYFKPAGIPLRFLSEVRLSVEEAEALRLKELDGLEQAEGAIRMGVSRPTFQRVLSSARKKVADALLNGKAIKIEGGSFQVIGSRMCCYKGHTGIPAIDTIGEKATLLFCDEGIKTEPFAAQPAITPEKGETEE
jgi:uncharacterized protein